MRSLVLFSNDLRLNDNDAINTSIKNHKSTAFVFIFDKNLYKKSHGSANLWWLEESLSQLRNQLLSAMTQHRLQNGVTPTPTHVRHSGN